MKYMGSKSAIAKEILPIILKERGESQAYVEPFVGGCNSIDKVAGVRIGGDINPYLIAMWKALQSGWCPPEEISRDTYNQVRNSYNKNTADVSDFLKGYVGFNGSYGGRFFDGGYAGIVITKESQTRNYPLEAFNNVSKQLPQIAGIDFYCCDYADLPIPPNSIIYCDPPYANTKKYKTESFDSDRHFEWCRQKAAEGHRVYVSERTAPDDFTCVWEKSISSSLRANATISGAKQSIERLFTLI